MNKEISPVVILKYPCTGKWSDLVLIAMPKNIYVSVASQQTLEIFVSFVVCWCKYSESNLSVWGVTILPTHMCFCHVLYLFLFHFIYRNPFFWSDRVIKRYWNIVKLSWEMTKDSSMLMSGEKLRKPWKGELLSKWQGVESGNPGYQMDHLSPQHQTHWLR